MANCELDLDQAKAALYPPYWARSEVFPFGAALPSEAAQVAQTDSFGLWEVEACLNQPLVPTENESRQRPNHLLSTLSTRR